MSEYAQKTVIDEGTDQYGINKQLIFHGGDMVVKTSYDPTAMMKECAEQRVLTADQRWGEMRKVGTIPMAEYTRFMMIKDQRERKIAIKTWLQQNPAFITFEKYKR